MNKTTKIITTCAIIAMLLSITTTVFGGGLGVTIQQPTGNGIQTIGGKVIGIIQVIGNVLAVGMLIVLGIKYMLGSAEDKAEYKKSMIPYLVGAVLIFAGANLANVIYEAINTTVTV